MIKLKQSDESPEAAAVVTSPPPKEEIELENLIGASGKPLFKKQVPPDGNCLYHSIYYLLIKAINENTNNSYDAIKTRLTELGIEPVADYISKINRWNSTSDETKEL